MSSHSLLLLKKLRLDGQLGSGSWGGGEDVGVVKAAAAAIQ